MYVIVGNVLKALVNNVTWTWGKKNRVPADIMRLWSKNLSPVVLSLVWETIWRLLLFCFSITNFDNPRELFNYIIIINLRTILQYLLTIIQQTTIDAQILPWDFKAKVNTTCDTIIRLHYLVPLNKFNWQNKKKKQYCYLQKT